MSERRNRTLLDMVRSMMNLTTLPKSLWGYALESAAHILNMVPTKKVDRMPYETWPGKAPKFFENSLTLQQASGTHRLLEASGSDVGLEFIQDDTQHSKNTSERRDEVEPAEVEPHRDFNEPPNYKAALSDPESDKWLNVMKTKMQSKKDNQVWSLVDLPPNGRTVGNIRAMRILLAIAVFYDYEIWQKDVKTTFLNGHLSEDVYMVQPEGFVDPKHHIKVCKLEQSIYGLKQASRSWNKRFDVEIKKIGFTQIPNEPCVYLKASGSNVAFLVLYVDDILIMGNNVTMLQDVKSWLGGEECGFDSNENQVVPKVDDVSLVDGVFNGAFGGDGDEDFAIGEGVVASSYSWVRSINSFIGGMMDSLILLEGLDDEAWVEAI
ncbi:retrotransposon protein, putative, ty1-copia subclass [Tanacetum coccineum]|uniref:Retrotransposon protein, putative, ty1-copia subclass n=1 Tax=Tanacetum coccineum TaxID=301880 RepID=A0ABQ5J7B5_9ASTR